MDQGNGLTSTLRSGAKWLAISSVVVGLLPVASTFTAGTVANVLGCRLNEAASHPCYIFGINIGDLLYTMGVAGWYTFLSIPLAGAGLVISGVLSGGVRLWEAFRE